METLDVVVIVKTIEGVVVMLGGKIPLPQCTIFYIARASVLKLYILHLIFSNELKCRVFLN